MTDLEFERLVDLHAGNARLGPGSDATTLAAFESTGLEHNSSLRVADIGCGTGASTLVLARALPARIVAVDLVPRFLEQLQGRAAAAGLADRIDTVEASMEDLPFDEESLDLMWSEGAIYLMGFEEGVRNWRRFLRPGGVMVVSELSWTSAERPAEIEAHWNREYPGIALPSAKIAALEAAGFAPLAHFMLDRSCWEDYLGPLERGFEAFLRRHGSDALSTALVEAERREIELFHRHGDWFTYGVYVARRVDASHRGG